MWSIRELFGTNIEKRMIKVIELVPTLVAGGAETMIKDYCLLFDKEKIDVHVVVIDHRYDTYNEKMLDEAGIKVTYLSELMYGDDTLNIFQKVIRKISRYYYWRRIVLDEKPDIIHLHLHLDKYIKVLPLKKLNCKLVMTIHNVIDNFFSVSKNAGDKYREYKEVYRLVHNHGMRLIALHDELKNELMSYFHTENVSTINNGVILDRFNPTLYNRDEIRKDLGIGENDFVVGNVASLSRQKNHELILDVFEQIAKDNVNARLLLIGRGERKSYIEERIHKANLQDKVILLSNRGDIPELMSAMDVFFFPSRWEGFGNVMIEAQSMGLRCVISDAVPLCTIVTSRVTVCDLEDSIDSWVKAVEGKDISVCPANHSISEYDMKSCVMMLENLYYSLL